MRPVDFHPEAQDDFDDAADYYDEQRIGLGDEFRDEVRDALDRIVARPTVYSYYPGTTARKHRVKRFPYRIVYDVTDDAILVFAVVHDKRQEGYWFHRMS